MILWFCFGSSGAVFWPAAAVFLVCGCYFAVGVLEVSWVDPTVFLCSLQACCVRLPCCVFFFILFGFLTVCWVCFASSRGVCCFWGSACGLVVGGFYFVLFLVL